MSKEFRKWERKAVLEIAQLEAKKVLIDAVEKKGDTIIVYSKDYIKNQKSALARLLKPKHCCACNKFFVVSELRSSPRGRMCAKCFFNRYGKTENDR